jgi:acetyl-CoA carboxylase biotin carboxyl carrier protein
VGRISNEDIEWLVALAAREGLVEIEVSEGDASVLVGCAASAALAGPVTAAESAADPPEHLGGALIPVRAPMAGGFYRAPAPDSPPFVDAGDDVQTGETVALIEAMKLYNDIPAPCSGRVERILANDGDHVEADQELMLIRPLGE